MSADRNDQGVQHRQANATHGLGHTRLGDVGEVSKADVRVEAFADCENASSTIGIASSLGGYSVEVQTVLTSLQNDLFDLAADLSAPMGQAHDAEPVRIVDAHIAWVSRATDAYRADLNEVDGFVLPGGTVASAMLFQARIAVRRAERTLLKAVEEHGSDINPLAVSYLNAASTLLFVLARAHNAEHGDIMWSPLASITPPADNVAQQAEQAGSQYS